MNKYVAIGVGVFVLAMVFLLGGSYVTAYNKAVNYETTITKFDESSKNTLSSYTLSVKEMAQVPDMYIEDLEKVIEATFTGRYGENGSQAVFQWIQEQNIQVDSSLYTNIQNRMSAGREEFKISQDRKIDACRNYERAYKTFWTGFWIETAGFSYTDMETKCKIVLDQDTIDTFESGIAEPVQL